jgi:hypothetical protein
MREMPTQVGSTVGDDRGTEGLPEVQESVLEHTPEDPAPRPLKALDEAVQRKDSYNSVSCNKSLSGREREDGYSGRPSVFSKDGLFRSVSLLWV